MGAGSRADGPIVVRKYGNRRLYRTDESCYVTLDELAGLVRDDAEFVVQDAKTGEDLTGVVLAQVILEEEKRGVGGAFPHALLRQLIRLRDERLSDFVINHLPRLTHIFLESSEALADTLDIAAASEGSIATGEGAVIAQLAAVKGQLDQVLDALEIESVD